MTTVAAEFLHRPVFTGPIQFHHAITEETGIGRRSLNRSRLHQALSVPGSQSCKNQQIAPAFVPGAAKP